MKKFRMALFNGYKKDAVDEYIEELTLELEKLQEEVQNGLSAESTNRQLEEENGRLKEQLGIQEEKLKKFEKDYTEFVSLMVSMKEDAKKVVTDAQAEAEQVLLMAKKEADEINLAARQNAEKISKQAQEDSENYRKSIEEKMKRRQQEEEQKFEAARSKVAEYLNSLNCSQNKMVEVYEEFGHIVEQLPLRLGDVFSEKPFVLLEDPEKKENE